MHHTLNSDGLSIQLLTLHPGRWIHGIHARVHPNLAQLLQYRVKQVTQPVRGYIPASTETQDLAACTHVAKDACKVGVPGSGEVLLADGEEEDEAGVECRAAVRSLVR